MPPGRVSASGVSGWATRAYPVLIAVAFVLSIFLATGASPYSAIRSVLVAALAVAVVQVLATILTCDPDRGAGVAALLFITIVAGQRPLALIVLLTVAVGVALVRLPTGIELRILSVPAVSRALTTIAVILVAVVCARGVADGTVGAALRDLVAERPVLRDDAAGTPDGAVTRSSAPDIYIVILDSYARSDKLSELFDFDNGEFVDEMEARGFDVAEASRSNYLLTHLTLASMLNARHVDELGIPASYSAMEPPYHYELRHVTNTGDVLGALRQQGYGVTSLASGYEDVALRAADTFVDAGLVNEFEVVLLDRTVLLDWAASPVGDALVEAHRIRVERTFDELIDHAARPSDGPRLVLAHFPAPHPPFSMGAAADVPIPPQSNLELRQETEPMTRASYREAFRLQTAAVNEIVLRALDAMLSSIDPSDVVIVMSDHGSRLTVHWSRLDIAELDERTANLFAARTPGHPNLFGDAPTPVNVFPVLFDAYLGGGFARQSDTVYYWRDDRPLDLVPVEGLASP